MKSKRVLLFSGGVDCLASYALLKEDVDVLLYVDLGHKYRMAERRAVRSLALLLNRHRAVKCFTATEVGQFEKENAEIPYRNLYLITVAKMFGDEVVISIEEGTQVNQSLDRSDVFMDVMNDMFDDMEGTRPVLNPVRELTKADEVCEIMAYFGREKGEILLRNVYSCYLGKFKACGVCPACVRKWFALRYYELEYGHDFGLGGWYYDEPIKSDCYKKYVVDVIAGKYAGRRGEQYKIVIGNSR